MKYICAIDIGSSKIAACIGYFKRKELVHLWWDSVAAAGVKGGFLQDFQALTACLAKLLKKLKAKSGVKIKSVYLGVTSQNIVAKHSRAVIALAERGNKSVTKRDIQRVCQQAQILGSCLEEEILHTIPISYTIDDENEVANPLGLYGHQLRVDLYLIYAKVTYINTIIEVINRLGLKLNNITLSGLSVSQAVFNSEKLRGLGVLCDIGKDVTQILIFKDSKLMYYQILTVGGDDLTASLSEELNLPYSLAEEIKISYGRIQHNYNPLRFHSGLRSEWQTKDEGYDKEIIVRRDNDYVTLSQNLITQILSKASWRIAEAIGDAIKPHILAVSLPSLPDKVILYVSGRTACLDGFLETLEVVIGFPVKMAKVNNPALLAPLMRHRFLSGGPILNYLASFGLLVEAIKLSHKQPVSQHHFRNLLSYIPDRIKEIYQEYF